MEIKPNKLTVLGCGPGNPLYVTPIVSNFVFQAELLVGCPRTLDLFPNSNAQKLVYNHNIDILLNAVHKSLDQCKRTVWLCTGDTSLFSISQVLIKHFGSEKCHIEPGISSVQIACAKLHIPLNKVCILSAHGKNLNLDTNKITKHFCILAGSPEYTQSLLDYAFECRNTHQLFICADLSLVTEIILPINPLEISDWVSHPRAIFFWRKYE